MKKLILTLTACLAFAFCAQAQSLKVATVDNRKVIESYYLVWQEDISYQQEDQRLVQEANEANKLRIAADEKLADLIKKVRDTSLPKEEIEKYTQEATKALEESNKLKEALESIRTNAIRNLAARKKRSHQEIMAKVNDVIAKLAQKEGFALVLNTAIDASNPYRTVLFDAGKNDITEEVIKQLNADKPEGAVKPDRSLLFN